MKALEKVDLLIERAIKEAEARKKEAYNKINEAMAGKTLEFGNEETKNLMETIHHYSNTDYLASRNIKILTALKNLCNQNSIDVISNENFKIGLDIVNENLKIIEIEIKEENEKIELFNILKKVNSDGLDLKLVYSGIEIYARNDKE